MYSGSNSSKKLCCLCICSKFNVDYTENADKLIKYDNFFVCRQLDHRLVNKYYNYNGVCDSCFVICISRNGYK